MSKDKSDPWLWWLATAVTVVGLLAIYDSGYARVAADGGFVPREFRNQLFAGLGAGFLGWLCGRARKGFSQAAVWALYACTLAALVVVKFAGTEINGARRWIDLKVMTVQPAEFAKLSVILVLASVFATRKPAPTPPRPPRHWAERLDWVWTPRLARAWPLLIVLVPAALVLAEPDMATAAMIAGSGVAVMLLGGLSRGSLLSLGLAGCLAAGLLVWKEPYRLQRVVQHEDRWSQENVDNIGYQTTQSEAAIARGGVFGVGLGEGRAKHTLPAPTTDFVMTTVAEETGLVGTWAVLGLMGALVWRLMRLAQGTQGSGKLVCGGTAAWIGVQACTNVLMVNGTLPPIGVPMPFVSAGGSSLLALWIAVGACQSGLRQRPQEADELEARRDRRWNRRARVSRA